MIELINLLKRWSELEPEKCQAFDDYCQLIKDDLYVTEELGEELDDDQLAQVQWYVQQATQARGWYWELRYWPPKQKHKAEVADNMSEWLDNPAEALLAAYVKALEAQGERSEGV